MGGTSARFALYSEQAGITEVRVSSCDRYPGLLESIRDYLAQIGNPRITDAVVAIATPVVSDQVQMTNRHWSFSIEATRRALSFRSLLVTNDFSATAMSLPHLVAPELRRIDLHGELRHGVKAVVGPGTGLGVAGLVPIASSWWAISSEGGHASISPADPFELEILRVLWADLPHISAERLLAGRGIALLYRAICKIGGSEAITDDSSRIVELAVTGSSAAARQTLGLYSGLLGGFAGNVALTFGSVGGLYLAGGVLAKLGSAFDIVRFNQRFVSKGRFEGYLESIPRFLITAENPALIGAAHQLKEFLAPLG